MQRRVGLWGGRKQVNHMLASFLDCSCHFPRLWGVEVPPFTLQNLIVIEILAYVGTKL